MVQNLLPNYLDDELGEEMADQVHAHLIQCRSCAWEVESIRQTLSALRRSAVPATPSPDFRDRLLAHLLKDHRAAVARSPYDVCLAQPQREPGPAFVLELTGKEPRNAGQEKQS